MIQITRHDGRISIQGHAGFAPHGQDIVCAGVSTLAQTLIASIENLTNDKIEYEATPGMVTITHNRLSDSARLLIDSFLLGVQMIAESYPNHVVVEKTPKLW